MSYRYRCGECSYSARWTTESEAEDLAAAHYAQSHPGLAPGGGSEPNRMSRRSRGCIAVFVIALFLILVVAL